MTEQECLQLYGIIQHARSFGFRPVKLGWPDRWALEIESTQVGKPDVVLGRIGDVEFSETGVRERIESIVARTDSKVRIHRLKTDPEPFEAVACGAKTCEIREDDRGFAVGDYLYLEKHDREAGAYLGPLCMVEVTDIRRGAYGVAPTAAVMSIKYLGMTAR